MASLWKYITIKWNRLFAVTPEEKYPAIDNTQKEYREEFGGIVDQYLISYSSERKEKPDGYHRIVYIDADNEIKWRISEDDLTVEDQKSRNYNEIAYLGRIVDMGYAHIRTFYYNFNDTACIRQLYTQSFPWETQRIRTCWYDTIAVEMFSNRIC